MKPLSQPGESFFMASSLVFADNNFHQLHYQKGLGDFLPIMGHWTLSFTTSEEVFDCHLHPCGIPRSFHAY